MTTASTRIGTFATALIMTVVVALGWFLGASPKPADAARFDAERTAVQAQNDLARATIAQLEADFEQIDELRLQLTELRDEFPTQAEYDTVIEELLTGLLAQGLVLQNIVINEPAPTTAVTLEDGTVPEPEIDGDGVLPTGSLLRITVAVTVNGSLPAALAFIQALQESPRFSIVPTGSFSGGGDAAANAMTFSVIMYVVTGEDLISVEPDVDAPAEPEPTATPGPTPGSESPTPTPTPTDG